MKAVPDTLTLLLATVNQASKLTTPAIRRCYAPAVNTPCDETTSIIGVVDNATSSTPVFITRATNVLTISPTTNLQSKTYTLKVTQQIANINTTVWPTGNIVWTTVSVTVTDCMITSIVPPPAPTTGISYKIHALSKLSINLSGPGFV